MSKAGTEPQVSLAISRTFAAPPEKVFAAWTRPEVLADWFHVAPGWSTPIAEVDLRVGGAYRIGMQNPESGEQHVMTGVYREIDEPSRLVFTMSWEKPDAPETLVTLRFVAQGGGTELMLTHERFLNEPMRDEHEQGWTGCLEQLAAKLG